MKAVSPTELPDSDAGFSLVEVLVALVLVSVMAVSMSVMTGQFRQLIYNTDRSGEKTALQAAVRYIAKQLEQAEAIPVNLQHEGPSLYISGEPEKIRFVTVMRLGVESEGFRNLEFGLNNRGELVQVISLRRKAGETNSSSSVQSVILEGAHVLEFGYFGEPFDATAPAWNNDWSVANRLPQAISVKVTKASKNGQSLTASAIAWLAVR